MQDGRASQMTEQFLLPLEALWDEHTKTYRSPVFRHLLDRESRRAIRYQEAFALLLVALDRNRNDAGDRNEEGELEIVAENIRREIRQTDLIGRIGETLILLLLHASNGETVKVAERARARIENYAFRGRSPGERIHYTVSIGAACFPLHTADSSLLVEHAMSCLRRAQEEGGNKVLLSRGEK